MSKEGKSLLVIDSEQSWLEFCEVTLKENGYEVYNAVDFLIKEEFEVKSDQQTVALEDLVWKRKLTARQRQHTPKSPLNRRLPTPECPGI